MSDTPPPSILDELDREPLPPTAAGAEPSREGWGLFPAIAPVDYFLDPCPQPSLSNSMMPRILWETPLDFAFHHPKLNPDFARDEAKASAAQRRGDIVGQLALGKGRGYAVGDFKDWRTKDAQGFRDRAISDGLTPIKRADFEEAEVMATVVRERIKRVLDGADYQTEVVFMYEEQTAAGPIWVRGMMDVWCEERAMILDPKVTANIYDGRDGSKLARHLLDMGWDRQGALYPHALGQIFPKLAGRIGFRDLMVKPEAPYTSRLVRIRKDWEYSAVKQCQLAFERFGACLYAGRWPGFGDDVYEVEMPAWEAKRRETAELEGRA